MDRPGFVQRNGLRGQAKGKLAKDPELRKEAEDHVLGLIGGAQLTNTLHLKWKLGELEKHLRGNARLRNSEIFEHLEKVVRDLRTTEQNMQVTESAESARSYCSS